MKARSGDLAARSAPLEYWFWKVGTRDGSAIVDFIVRREAGLAIIRVSTWTATAARPVVTETSTTWATTGGGIRIGDAHLDERGSAGSAGGISWDVVWDLGAERLQPRPDWLGPLHPYDLEIVGRPMARVRGSLVIDGSTLVLDGPAGVHHYWGRRLPERWCWVSATGLDDDPAGRVEALVAYSRTWGHRPTTLVAYVWLALDGRIEQTVMPISGIIRDRSTDHSLRLSSLRVDGRRHLIECSAPASSFNDAGAGIVQTMLADLNVDGRRRATGSVGLEFRRQG